MILLIKFQFGKIIGTSKGNAAVAFTISTADCKH